MQPVRFKGPASDYRSAVKAWVAPPRQNGLKALF